MCNCRNSTTNGVNIKRPVVNPKLRIAIAITTYAAVPYIHLQLETWKRYYPQHSIVVIDDCSGADFSICEEYGVDVISNSTRLGWAKGDMTAFATAIDWACGIRADWLLKISRRWLPLNGGWQDELPHLINGNCTTLSNICTSHAYGFRTEFIGMSVPYWRNYRETIRSYEGGLPEHFIHVIADQFCTWHWMGTDRYKPPNALWHNRHDVLQYLNRAKELGIDKYHWKDFLV